MTQPQVTLERWVMDSREPQEHACNVCWDTCGGVNCICSCHDKSRVPAEQVNAPGRKYAIDLPDDWQPTRPLTESPFDAKDVRNSRQRQANADLQRAYDRMQAERDEWVKDFNTLAQQRDALRAQLTEAQRALSMYRQTDDMRYLRELNDAIEGTDTRDE